MAEINKYDELLEKVAALEHEQWSHWTKYFLDNLTPENIERWRGQIKTDYADLTRKEQESDIVWAKKVVDFCLQRVLKAHCWRDLTKFCLLSSCCYDASCCAVFDYWKFANSDKWKKMVAEEVKKQALKREKMIAEEVKKQSLKKSAFQQIDDLFSNQGLKDKQEFMQLLEKIKVILVESVYRISS